MDPADDRLLEEFQARLSRIELDVPRLERLAPKRPLRPALEVRPAAQAPGGPAFAAWRPRLGWALLAALLAGSAPAFWSAARRAASGRGPAHQSFALPFTSTAGLAVQNGTLYTLDPIRQLLLAFTASRSGLKVLAIRKFSSAAEGGLAWGEDCFWSTDPQNGRIYRHKLDPAYSVMKTYSNPESHPSAVYWDGGHLWTSDARTETLFQYNVDGSLTPARQYTLPGMVPVGIHVEGDVLWVFDGLSRKAYAYGLGGFLAARDSIDFREKLPATCRVTGFAADGASIWIVTENPAEIHRFDLRRLKREANAHGTAP